MAIKIIKEGQKEFHAICETCGCEFTYEISDLKLSSSLNKIPCPTCGKDYYHKSQTGGGCSTSYFNWPTAGEPIPCIDQNRDSCADCEWPRSLQGKGTYIGDIPCNWCSKKQFSCNISGGSILQSGSYPEAFLNTSTTSSSCSAGTTATIHLDPINFTTDQVDDTYVDKKLQEVYNAAGCTTCRSCGDAEPKNNESHKKHCKCK